MYFITGYIRNAAITIGTSCGKHLDMKDSFVAVPPFKKKKKKKQACLFSLHCPGSLIHMGSFLFVLLPQEQICFVLLLLQAIPDKFFSSWTVLH